MTTIDELERLRGLRVCLLLPASEPDFVRALFVACGRVIAARSIPRGGGARLEVAAGLAQSAGATPSLDPEDGDELLVIGSFLRRPPPELTVVQLEEERDRSHDQWAGSLGCVTIADTAGRPTTAVEPFSDRVATAVERRRTQLVVGLDPLVDLLPVEVRGDAAQDRPAAAAAVERFCCGIVDAVAPYVAAVKPQVAFFEALGADGWTALESVCAYAHDAGLLVIADAKRGDIGSTSRAYAAAFLEPRGERPPLADALTVNPYLGEDAIDPFLSSCRRHGAGVFVLVRTSNAGAADLQDAQLSDGRPLWQLVADLVRTWGEDLVGSGGLSSVGAVVGATYPRAIGEARRAMPQAILLLPGVGAQGASPADVARAFTSGPASGLVNASRAVIYAFREGEPDWRLAASRAAAALASEVWASSGW